MEHLSPDVVQGIASPTLSGAMSFVLAYPPRVKPPAAPTWRWAVEVLFVVNRELADGSFGRLGYFVVVSDQWLSSEAVLSVALGDDWQLAAEMERIALFDVRPQGAWSRVWQLRPVVE